MENEFKEVIKERLKEIRANKKMTQKEFSEFIKISQQTLSGYENGKMLPSLEIVKDISEKCNVSCDWLLGISNKKELYTKYETYADIIKCLVDISESIDCYFSFAPEVPYEMYDPENKYQSLLRCLVIEDDKIQSFLKEWVTIYELHDKMTINDELYRLWIEDKLKNNKDKIIKLPF